MARKSSIVILVAGAGLLAASVAVWWHTSVRHVAATGKQPQSLSDDGRQVVIRFATNPQSMPPFLLNDLDGAVISTASWHGKVVLLNFWATWCPPCRDEIPELIALSKRFKDRLQIVGVSMDDGPPEDVNRFAKEMGIDYPIVMGSTTLSSEYGGVPVLPTSFVVNTDGRIVQKHEGLYPIDRYESEVRSLLGMPVDAKIETFEDTGQIFLKNAANAKQLPGVDFNGLTEDQKRAALRRLNSEICTCGCKLTLAQCRINDSECSTSQQLAQKIVREIRSASTRSPARVSTPIRQ
jgi:thiol-disulfide isomerase/thioredoxin